MSKRKGTDEKELQDAIDRIGKHPDATQHTTSGDVWQNYLLNVIRFGNTVGIPEYSLSTDNGKAFWENVRQGIIDKFGESAEPVTQVETRPEPVQPSGKHDYFVRQGRVVEATRDAKGRFVSTKTVTNRG